jgi:hypothetical protein
LVVNTRGNLIRARVTRLAYVSTERPGKRRAF